MTKQINRDNKAFTSHTAFDMYMFYTKKLLQNNKNYVSANDQILKRNGIDVIYKQGPSGKIKDREIVMTYTMFKSIITMYNKIAQEYVTEGVPLRLGHGLGYLQARRIERNFNRLHVDIISTMQERRRGVETTIYHTDEDYCRIAWVKLHCITNESYYEFRPCKAFKSVFSNNNKERPWLKFEYKFVPIRKKKIQDDSKLDVG